MNSKEREQITILCEKIGACEPWERLEFVRLTEELLALLDRVLDKTAQ